MAVKYVSGAVALGILFGVVLLSSPAGSATEEEVLTSIDQRIPKCNSTVANSWVKLPSGKLMGVSYVTWCPPVKKDKPKWK